MTQQNRPDLARHGIDSRWLRSAPAARRLLLAYAHPDDESFGNAGTIARYAAEGAAVHYACATRGECGGVDPQLLDGYRDIAALREAELDCAARTTGLAAVHYLGYRDSGMPGAPDNQHPSSLMQAPLEEVTGRLVALIRALQPQVVITFNAFGGYGHPDHIAIHKATVAAFGAAGDAGRYPEQVAEGLAPFQPQKLYFSTFSARFLRWTVAGLRLLGRAPGRLGRNGDIDLGAIVGAATPVTTVVDVGAHMERQEAAWECHGSQLAEIRRARLLPSALRRRLYGTERFTRVEPAWADGAATERDLFEGIGDGAA